MRGRGARGIAPVRRQGAAAGGGRAAASSSPPPTHTHTHRPPAQVLAVASFVPSAFAAQLALSEKNMWGILRWLVELVRKHRATCRCAREGRGGTPAVKGLGGRVSRGGSSPLPRVGSRTPALSLFHRRARPLHAAGGHPDDEYMAKFLLMRDGNKPSLMLYSVPLDAFDPAEDAAAGAGCLRRAARPGATRRGAAPPRQPRPPTSQGARRRI